MKASNIIKAIRIENEKLNDFVIMQSIIRTITSSTYAAQKSLNKLHSQVHNDYSIFHFYEQYFMLSSKLVQQYSSLQKEIDKYIKSWQKELKKIFSKFYSLYSQNKQISEVIAEKNEQFDKLEGELQIAVNLQKVEPSNSHRNAVDGLLLKHMNLDEDIKVHQERHRQIKAKCDEYYMLCDRQLNEIYDEMCTLQKKYYALAGKFEDFEGVEVVAKELYGKSLVNPQEMLTRYLSERAAVQLGNEPPNENVDIAQQIVQAVETNKSENESEISKGEEEYEEPEEKPEEEEGVIDPSPEKTESSANAENPDENGEHDQKNPEQGQEEIAERIVV